MKRLLSAVLTLALLLVFCTPQTRAGGQSRGCIALTFDDGPSGELTACSTVCVHAASTQRFSSAATGSRSIRRHSAASRRRATRLGCTAAAMIICTKCPAKPYTTIWSPAWRP